MSDPGYMPPYRTLAIGVPEYAQPAALAWAVYHYYEKRYVRVGELTRATLKGRDWTAYTGIHDSIDLPGKQFRARSLAAAVAEGFGI